MFESVTQAGRQVLVVAQEEARARGHQSVGTEHILLGLLADRDGIPSKVLENLGILGEAVRAQVGEIIGPGEDRRTTAGRAAYTPRAKKVLELSMREAAQLGHSYIGPEHLLLGLVREAEGVAAHVLIRLGADLGSVREQVIVLMTGQTEVAAEPSGYLDEAMPRDSVEERLDRIEAALEDVTDTLAQILRHLEGG